jgi:tRNA modification GTPase
MNALLKDARAIVTEIAGTTRDLIEEFMNIGGIPIKLVDTAGIRDTEDVVEKIGVERSKIAFNEADLIIFMLNAAEALSEEDLLIMDLVKDKHAIVIVNKTDLEQKIDYSKIEMILHDKRIIRTSIERDTGISDVEKAISEMVLTQQVGVNENEIISNSRHIHLLEVALTNVKDAKKATQARLPYDFIEVDIKDAILNLGKITGESVESDLLNSIFSNFCLGK